MGRTPDSDEHSVALARFRAERGDRTLDLEMAEVARWQDGKVVERWAFFDDREAGYRFWS